ncbi:MAG: tRNA (N(6)-L-threonylcarbamoyladenosine(37)-C(2))-methylthiotransferase MtaB [Bacillota bacterium]
MKRRVAFLTLGCKTNQYDTAVMTAAFRDRGYEIVDFDDHADVYVINTCAVTARSQAKSRQAVRRARRANPSAVVAVAGCYPQVAPGEVESFEGVDVVTGASGRGELPRYVEEVIESGIPVKRVDRVWSCREFEESEGVLFHGRTRAFLKIEDGCEHFCSYCIVPFARGPVRSRPVESILKETGRLAAQGFKEIVLTGIHLGEYGRDMAGKGLNLARILEMVCDVDGIQRVRLSSVEPGDITEELIQAALRPNVCPHLHVPLQSGSDRILQAMNRGYSRTEYAALAARLKQAIPGLGLTTDVMVGFPGETEEDFEQTCDIVEEVGFSRLHVFPFSPRKGTAAERMGGQIPRAVKEQRARSLITIGRGLSRAFHEGLVGTRVSVLIEERAGGNRGPLEGLTGSYVRVWLNGPSHLKGSLVDVEVIGADSEGVDGVLLANGG